MHGTLAANNNNNNNNADHKKINEWGRMEHDDLRLKRLRKITSLQVEIFFFTKKINLIGKLIRWHGWCVTVILGCFIVLVSVLVCDLFDSILSDSVHFLTFFLFPINTYRFCYSCCCCCYIWFKVQAISNKQFHCIKKQNKMKAKRKKNILKSKKKK